MDDIRRIIFFIGLAFMVVSLFVVVYPRPLDRPYDQWLWRFGFLLAFGSHAWPG